MNFKFTVPLPATPFLWPLCQFTGYRSTAIHVNVILQYQVIPMGGTDRQIGQSKWYSESGIKSELSNAVSIKYYV